MHPEVIRALRHPACACLAACLLLAGAAAWGQGQETAAVIGRQSTDSPLERARLSGDLAFQRNYMQRTLTRIAAPDVDGLPGFLGWAGRAELFGRASSDGTFTAMAARDLAWRDGAEPQSGQSPLITFVHYNSAAAAHVAGSGLGDAAVLAAHASGGRRADMPALPSDAVVAMSAWWPVARDEPTPLPVWSGEQDGADGYLSWPRVVAIGDETDSLAFAGRVIEAPETVTRDQFVSVQVTAPLAAALAAYSQAASMAYIALGRPVEAGDSLVLVALHVMTGELPGGLWATWWWDDRAPRSAASATDGVWANYRMDAAFDAVLPRAADGGPHVCFNPWFDAALPAPDEGVPAMAAGQGGTRSNCQSCHARASWPMVDPTLVTRGAPDLARDQAFQPGQVATAMLWSPVLAASRDP